MITSGFTHIIGLRYETSPSELSSILDEIRNLLAHDLPPASREGLRVRLLGFGRSGFEVEVFAYIFARDWSDFLEIQESLLLHIMELVQAKGAHIARPSQTIYLAQSAEAGATEMGPLRKAVPSGG